MDYTKEESTEYIEEIDKVYKPFMYTILERVIPMIKRLRKKPNKQNE
ncbi:hypothetical protein [Virgibacillus sp. DJP39]